MSTDRVSNTSQGERRAVLLASIFGLLALGALQASYGPAFPSLMARYGVAIDEVGTTVILHFMGGFVSILAAPLFLLRVGYRRTLLLAGGLASVGMALAAFGPTWSILIVAATLGGVGFGLFNIVMNLLVTRVFSTNAAPYLNLLSAMFGLGAVAGPALIASLSGSLMPVFFGLAAFALVATLFAGRAADPAPETPTAGSRVPWGLAMGFSLIYLLYVGTEASVATWETVHLEPSVGLSRAAVLTSAFWIAMTVGRFVAIPVSTRIRPRYLVLGASALGMVCLGLTHFPALAPAAYVLAGFFLAPIFPTTLAWITAVFPKRSERIIPIVMAVGAIGPIAATAMIGPWAAFGGTSVIPTALTTVAAALVGIAVVMVWATRSRGLTKP